MLSREDNERLVRVGKGTPLGELLRLYWIPFLPSGDIVNDGQPKRIRLLGEDLVAFRDSEGRVGLVDQACPHRGAPLIFGRNEDCGLRCVYHGWKFDVTGAVTDMPAEPVRCRTSSGIWSRRNRCISPFASRSATGCRPSKVRSTRLMRHCFMAGLMLRARRAPGSRSAICVRRLNASSRISG